jgi:hypothetical protein
MTNEALVIAKARAQVGLSQVECRQRAGPASLRLSDVRLRHLTDRETLLRRPQFVCQDFDVVFPDAQNTLVADHIDIGTDGIAQSLLLRQAEQLPPRANIGFRDIDTVKDPKAAKQRLRHSHAHALGMGLAIARTRWLGIAVADTDIRRSRDRRTIASFRARNFFVAGAQRGALGIERRACHVSRRQRLLQTFGVSHRCQGRKRRGAQKMLAQVAQNAPNPRCLPAISHADCHSFDGAPVRNQ